MHCLYKSIKTRIADFGESLCFEVRYSFNHQSSLGCGAGDYKFSPKRRSEDIARHADLFSVSLAASGYMICSLYFVTHVSFCQTMGWKKETVSPAWFIIWHPEDVSDETQLVLSSGVGEELAG